MDRGRHFAVAVFAVAAFGVGMPGVAAGRTVTVHPGGGNYFAEAPFGEAPLLQGETLRIALRPPSSGSTGYHWRIARRPSSRLLRRLYFHTSGDGRFEVLAYRARRSIGETRLQLRYESPTGREVRKRRGYPRGAGDAQPPKERCFPPPLGTQTGEPQGPTF